jgi:ferredoxin-like protein FixX
MDTIFKMRSRPRERTERLQQVKATVERDLGPTEARYYLGDLEGGIVNGFYAQRRYQDAEAYGRQVLKAYAAIDPPPAWSAWLCMVVGEAALQNRHYDVAEHYYHLAIKHGAAVTTRWLEEGCTHRELIDRCKPHLLGGLGTVYERQGRLEDARECDKVAIHEVIALPVPEPKRRFQLINIETARRMCPFFVEQRQWLQASWMIGIIYQPYLEVVEIMDTCLYFLGGHAPSVAAMEAVTPILLAFADDLMTNEYAEHFMTKTLGLDGTTAADLRDYADRLGKDIQETKTIMDSIRLSALQETRDEMAHARRAHQADKADTCDRHGQQSKKGFSKKKQKKKQQKRQRNKARKEAEAQQPADGTSTGGSSAKQDGETAQSLEHKVGQPIEDAYEKADAPAITAQQNQQKEEEEEEPEVEACPICEWDDDDDEKEEGAARVALACGHSMFHRLCLQAWSRKCREKGLDFTCPMCRAIITTDI